LENFQREQILAGPERQEQKEYSFPLFSILLLASIFYITFMSRIVLAPMLPIIEAELGLGHGEAGSLFLYIASGYSLGLFGSGFASAIWNHRRTLLIATILIGAAMLVISSSKSAFQMHAALVLAGFAAGLYLPSGVATLTGLVRKEHWGKAIAVHEIAPNLAFVTTPMLAEILLKFLSWRGAVAVIGAAAFFIGTAFLLFGAGGKYKGQLPNFKLFKKIILTSGFWIMVGYFSAAVGSSIGIYTMMPLYFVNEVGIEREWANTLIGLSRSAGILALLFSGLAVDRLSPQRAIILFLGTTGVLTVLLGFLHSPVPIIFLIFMQAASTACLFPVGFTVISRIFPAQFRNVAISMIFLVCFLFGGGLIPTAIGYWAEIFSFSSGIALIGIFFLGVLVLALRARERFIPVDS
jgi:NNP family nitrate/nitrite transporter-like MFS transporter